MPVMPAASRSTAPAGGGVALDARLLRGLPSVEQLASEALLARWDSPAAARSAARIVLAEARAAVVAGRELPARSELVARTDVLMAAWIRPGPRRVINATGLILHT